LIAARGDPTATPASFVQLAIDPPQADLGKSVGLTVDQGKTNGSGQIWNCPDRPNTLPVYEASYPQWVIGYQYFGGITTWLNPYGSFSPAWSPIKTTTSKPHWTLAADAVIRDPNQAWGQWGNLRDDVIWGGAPPHRCGTAAPKGANHLTIDASVAWVKANSLYKLHSWDGEANRLCYFYQDPKDFTGQLANPTALNSLRFPN
jgi:hypothetical protein